MPPYWWIPGILAVWRVTHLLNAEDGPWDSLVGLRRLAGNGMFGRGLDCFYCLSLWVSAPFSVLLATDWTGFLILWPGLSGGAILLERLTGQEFRPPPASFTEDEE